MKSAFGIFVCCVILFSSCSNGDSIQPNKLIYSNDFEQLIGWSNCGLDIYISDEQASNGTFSCKTDTINRYSLGFARRLPDITKKGIRNIRLNAKIFPVGSANAKMVVQIFKGNNNDSTLFWYGLDSQTIVKENNKWFEIRDLIALPPLPVDSRILIYFWNTGNMPLYIDEFNIEFIEK